MMLSEALALRADTQRRIMQVRERLRVSALVQEGEAPPEDQYSHLIICMELRLPVRG